jgi:hypothetical protein
MSLPTRLDRYPAKMVSKLADRLVEHYALDAGRILDPFCGSGAVLVAARRRGIPVTGLDINPAAALFSHVKLNGFDPAKAERLAYRWIRNARTRKTSLPVEWASKHYWFTNIVLNKFERLRAAAQVFSLPASDEGMAVLLSYFLAIRLCSRADQRSPKPFISKLAIINRRGRHFDPYSTITGLLSELSSLYGKKSEFHSSRFVLENIASSKLTAEFGKYTHVITSPPYINAQDYFRNFKLELYLLEGILPFRVGDLRDRFIGTERGDLLSGIPQDVLDANLSIVMNLRKLERKEARLAAVVHRYVSDMGRVFSTIKTCLEPRGCLVLVCGDNLVGGLRIRTWHVLEKLLKERGFNLFDRFSDPIGARLLAPKRSGHKGLIKEEVVSAYQLS